MVKAAAVIELSEQEENTLKQWARRASGEQRQVERARIVLLASDGYSTQAIARQRHGTTHLLAALNVVTGQMRAKHYRRRRRREFLDFMNEITAAHPGRELHVVLDNLNTHKPKRDQWLQRHPLVHFHYTPTYASWLNQAEVWFSVLQRRAL